jgi:uncharacterized membrane protein
MTPTRTLDDDGFRIRGGQPTRADAFVDAAFAFAVTLLVIAIGHVPASVGDLVQAMRGVPAFAASFFVIARLWQSHRHWSRRYGIEDDYATRLSLLLVFVVLVYVYPLRMIAELALAGVSGGVLSEHVLQIGSVAELRTLYAVFGIGYAVTAAIFLLLQRHALALADAIDLSASERIRTRTLCMRWLAVIAIALASTLFAIVLPMGLGESMPLDSAPGLVYIFVYVAFSLLKRREGALLGRAAAEQVS